jgi:hypothetical protein
MLLGINGALRPPKTPPAYSSPLVPPRVGGVPGVSWVAVPCLRRLVARRFGVRLACCHLLTPQKKLELGNKLVTIRTFGRSHLGNQVGSHSTVASRRWFASLESAEPLTPRSTERQASPKRLLAVREIATSRRVNTEIGTPQCMARITHRDLDC